MKNLNIKHGSSIPLHKQIEDELRRFVNDNKGDDSFVFPKEVAISNYFGVSRNTVRQAISSLVHEGMLIRKKGVGTAINRSSITSKLDNWLSFSQEMIGQGILVKNYVVEVFEENASAEIADMLNIKEGVVVIKLNRLRGDESIPFVYFESWFHPRTALSLSDNFQMKLYELIFKKSSVRVGFSSENISAILADKYLSGILGVEENQPVLKRVRKVKDTGGRIVEYNKCYYRADCFSYNIDLKLEE